mgnify:CR=1 FL=1
MINKEDILNFLRREWGFANGKFTYKSYELYSLEDTDKFEEKVLEGLYSLALEDADVLPCYIMYFKSETPRGLYGGFLVKDGNICPKSDEQYRNILKGIYD